MVKTESWKLKAKGWRVTAEYWKKNAEDKRLKAASFDMSSWTFQNVSEEIACTVKNVQKCGSWVYKAKR